MCFTFCQAPTILDLAGAAVPDDMDGVSLKQALMMGDDERQAEEVSEKLIADVSM